MTGLFKHQLDTWDKSKEFQTQIIAWIRKKLEERSARKRNTGIERTMGYSDTLEALTEQFGMGPEKAHSQLVQNLVGGQEDIRSQAN